MSALLDKARGQRDKALQMPIAKVSDYKDVPCPTWRSRRSKDALWLLQEGKCCPRRSETYGSQE